MEWIAEEVGIGPSAICKMEAGHPIPKKMIPHLERIYGHTLDSLTGTGIDRVSPGTAEHRLVAYFTELSPSDRANLMSFAAYLAERSATSNG